MENHGKESQWVPVVSEENEYVWMERDGQVPVLLGNQRN
jgi:hypothetical protein